MNESVRLLALAALLEHSADALACFVHHAKSVSDVYGETRHTAFALAQELLPEEDSAANGIGTDTRRLRHAAASALLQFASHSRAGRKPDATEIARGSKLAEDLIAAAGELRLCAATLD